jgi:hypothetical protein
MSSRTPVKATSEVTPESPPRPIPASEGHRLPANCISCPREIGFVKANAPWGATVEGDCKVARLPVESCVEVRWEDDEGLMAIWKTGASTREVVACSYDFDPVLRIQIDDVKRSAAVGLFLEGEEVRHWPA